MPSATTELHESGGRRATDHRNREPLHRPRREQPGLALRGCEQDQPDAGGAEAAREHRATAEPVRQPAEEHQSRHEHDRVRREDRGQHERREAEPQYTW